MSDYKPAITIEDFVSEKIKAAFAELTDELADGLAQEYGENMPTGSLVIEMMMAEIYLQTHWHEYCKNRMEKNNVEK